MTVSSGDSRTRILDAATSLIAERGLDAVTMRAVASAAGFSPMATYRHFDDKEALLTAALERGFDDFAHYLSRGSAGGTAGEALTLTVDAFRDFAIEHGATFELMFLTTHLPPGLRERAGLRRRSRRAYRILVDRVRACVGPEVDDADVEIESRRMLSAAIGVVALHRNGVLASNATEARRGYDAVMGPIVADFVERGSGPG